MKLLALTLALPSLFLFGCDKQDAGTTTGSTPPASADNSATNETAPPPTEEQKPQSRKLVGGDMQDGEQVAVMDTTAGKIVLRFFRKEAPKTVENFETLAKKGFYDGTKFHRTIPGFMIQGGDPNTKDKGPETWGTGGPGYKIQDELNDVKHEAGILSMAHAGPNTGGSQFFIMVGTADHLNHVHTAFGEVVSGMDVVEKIVNTPQGGPNGMVDPNAAVKINSVKLEKWPLKE